MAGNLAGSYLRVIWKGEVYFVIGEREELVPPREEFGEYLLVPVFLLLKLEETTHLKTPLRMFQAYPFECVPFASEIQAWLGRRVGVSRG